MNRLNWGLAGLCLWIAGCPSTPPTPPEAAVLAGRWTVTPDDPGDFEDVDFEAEFDEDGMLTELSATRADGATATLQVNGATSEVSGSDVTISIPKAGGTSVFEGTLSEDENTLTGMTTDEIDLEDLEITLPGGMWTLTRIAS